MATEASVNITYTDVAKVEHDLGKYYYSTKPGMAAFFEDVEGVAWFVVNNLQRLYSTEADWLANEAPLQAAVVEALKDVHKDPRFTTEISNFYQSRYQQLAKAAKVAATDLMPDGRPYSQLAPTLQIFTLRAGYVIEADKPPVFVRYEVPYSGPTPAMPPPTPCHPVLPQSPSLPLPPPLVKPVPEPNPEAPPAENPPAPEPTPETPPAPEPTPEEPPAP